MVLNEVRRRKDHKTAQSLSSWGDELERVGLDVDCLESCKLAF